MMEIYLPISLKDFGVNIPEIFAEVETNGFFIRSINLLRIIEHSKVIWHVMNAPIRLTTTVPV